MLTGRWNEQAPPAASRDARRAYRVVDLFERELCDYTGAPFAVSMNSCTNALFLSLQWSRRIGKTSVRTLEIPRRTYVGVLQAVLNAGFSVRWSGFDSWQFIGHYVLWPMQICDSARLLKRGMYHETAGHLTCLSFHSAKQLPIGRGGAILTDNEEAAEWFRAARMDGRPPGSSKVQFPGWHMPMPPDAAARGLDILSRWNDAGYSPPPLPFTDYPDLSQWHP